MAGRPVEQGHAAGGYLLAAGMALLIIVIPPPVGILALIFAVGGIYVAMEETLEDSFCAELVAEPHHGVAEGTLATVNGVEDFVSSLAVGALWSAFNTQVAFAYTLVLSRAGAAPI